MNYRTASLPEVVFAARRHLDNDVAMPLDLLVTLDARGIRGDRAIRNLAAHYERAGNYGPIEHLRDIAFDPEGFTVSDH